MGKYDDQVTFPKILHRKVWIGQTAGEHGDSLGRPSAIDEEVPITKTREVWEYNPIGSRGLRKRITVENGEVVSWDIKDT